MVLFADTCSFSLRLSFLGRGTGFSGEGGGFWGGGGVCGGGRVCGGGGVCEGGDGGSGDWVRGLVGLTGLVGCITTYSSGSVSCVNLGVVLLLKTGRGGGTGGP